MYFYECLIHHTKPMLIANFSQLLQNHNNGKNCSHYDNSFTLLSSDKNDFLFPETDEWNHNICYAKVFNL